MVPIEQFNHLNTKQNVWSGCISQNVRIQTHWPTSVHQYCTCAIHTTYICIVLHCCAKVWNIITWEFCKNISCFCTKLQYTSYAYYNSCSFAKQHAIRSVKIQLTFDKMINLQYRRNTMLLNAYMTWSKNITLHQQKQKSWRVCPFNKTLLPDFHVHWRDPYDIGRAKQRSSEIWNVPGSLGLMWPTKNTSYKTRNNFSKNVTKSITVTELQRPAVALLWLDWHS